MKIALILTVFAFGGPPHAKPHEIDAHLEVATAAGAVVATSQVGNLTVGLRPGTYTVTASGAGRVCSRRVVHLGHRRGEVVKAEMGCSVP